MIRKISALLLIIAVATTVVTVLHPGISSAANPFNDACSAGGTGVSTSNATVCNAKNNSTTNPLVGKGGVLTNVANILATVGGIMVVIMIIIGGFKYITSNGDSSQAASAKNTIIYGLIGVVVIALARGIVSFIVTRIK